MSRRRYTLVVSTLVLTLSLVFLVGNGAVGLFDRDEPRYATASLFMAGHGDWVVPQFLGTPRTAKPILIYWLQASAMTLLGPTGFAARLPSAIAMSLTLVLLAASLPGILGRRRSAWAVFVLGTSTMTLVSAKMALTDATLLLFVTASQLAFYRLWIGRRDVATFVALGLSIGLASLTKGPVVLGVLATTALVLGLLRLLDRVTPAAAAAAAPASSSPASSPPALSAAGWIGRVGLALTLAAAVLSPWLVMIELRLPGYLMGTLDREIVQRGTTAAEGHAGPPGFYLLTIWGTFFPWSLALPAAIVCGWRRRAVPPLRFALAAVVGPWLMLELYVTKLPHYLLPAFPFLAILVADLLTRSRRSLNPTLRGRGFRVVAFAWPLLVGLGVAGAWASLLLDPLDLAALLTGLLMLTIVSLATSAFSSHAWLRGRATPAAVSMGLGMAAAVLLAWTMVLPNLRALQISPRIADALLREGATRVGDVRMVDYKEPSLGFYQGGTIREELEDRFFHVVPPEQWPRWLVTSERVWADAPAAARSRWIEVADARGLQYAGGGRWVRVLVLRQRPAPPASRPATPAATTPSARP